MKQESKNRSRNPFFIGLISFFGGISQDIFLPILPLYLSGVLGFGKEIIGLAEGFVTSSASIFKIVSGFLSDKFRKSKPIVFAGYFISLISRPLLALTSSVFGVIGLRLLDGIGKGVKDSAKDVLIAESTSAGSRGRGFGIVRALDTFGSVVGPILLFGLLYLLRDNDLKYRYIFFLTAIPLTFTLLILWIFVKEVPSVEKISQPVLSLKLPKRFYIFMAIMTIFAIGNSSDAFLILRAQDVGVSFLVIPLVYALFNFFYASASIPLGSLSDKIGREKVILIGWLSFALAYLGFGLANQSWQIWLLFAFYGIYYATTEGVAKAFVADLTTSEHRGRAYGIYNSVVGLAALPASFIAGLLWEKFGPQVPFYFGSAIAAFAVVALFVFTRFNARKVSVI